MELDVAAWQAVHVISPHTKKRVTAKKLLGRNFILEFGKTKSKETIKQEYEQRKLDLKRAAREMSRRG